MFPIFLYFVSSARYRSQITVCTMLTETATLSIVIAVIVAMAGIAISRPSSGRALGVGLEIPLVKGLGPVMNIILAYGIRIPSPHHP